MDVPRSNLLRTDGPVFTVVIPTYGESTYLPKVLAALLEQTYQDFDIVVVDNNPHPRTQEICTRFAPAAEFLHCPQRGLSAARNAGIAATQSEYIAFLDDDSIPDATWAAELNSGLRRHECAAAGGRVELALDGSLPAWYPDRLRCLLSELRYDGADIPALADGQYLVGANFCVARHSVESVGGFREDFGRDGPRLESNEELELCRRITNAGGKIAFLADCVVRHQVPARRYTFRYFLRRSLWQGRSDAALDVLHGRSPIFRRRSNALNIVALFHRLCLLGLAADRKESALAAANVLREVGYLGAYYKATRQKRGPSSQSLAVKAKASE